MSLSQNEINELIKDIYGLYAHEKPVDVRSGEYFAQEAYKASQERKKYERIEKEMLDKLKMLSEGKTTEWGEFVFMKTTRAGSINYAAIPELLNVRLEEYRKADVEAWALIKK